MSQVYSLVNQEETQRGVNNNSVQAMQTNIERNAFFSGKRNTKKSVHHNKKEGLHCNYCNGKGHTKENCFRLVGYRSWHPLHNKSKKGMYHHANQTFFANDDNNTQRNVGHDAQITGFGNTNGLNLTREQIQQLMHLLNNNSTVDSTANLAGNSFSLCP